MSPGLIQACNPTSPSQYDITTRTTCHTPFYFSTNIPVQPHHPEPNTSGDAAVTWDMSATCGTKVGQIDEQSLHAVKDNRSRDKKNEEQYVVWNHSGFSLIRRGRSRLVVANTPKPNQHAHEIYQSAGLTLQASTASIPMSECQSGHLQLPTGAGIHPTPAREIDTDRLLSRQDAHAGPIRQQASSRKHREALQRVYDKPGKKEAHSCSRAGPSETARAIQAARRARLCDRLDPEGF